MSEETPQDPGRARVACRAATGVGIVAAVFTAVVCAMLIVTFVQLTVNDPLNSPSLVKLREKYAQNTTNEEFKEQFPNYRFRKGAAQHPKTKVSWHEAKQYCEKVGGRLPTEPEWEKAARGELGSVYPWGDHKPKKHPHPFYSGVVKKNVGSSKTDISSYGIHDMAGSVWEWTDDSKGPLKIIRGGLWNHHLDFEYSKAFEKATIPPGERLSFLGFRCVRSME